MLVLSYAVALVPFDPERVVALRGIDRVVFKRPSRWATRSPWRGRCGAHRPRRGHGLVATDLRVRNHHGELVARGSVNAVWRRDPGLGSHDPSRLPSRWPAPSSRSRSDARRQAPPHHRRVTRHSIAWAVADARSRPGAEVVLTGFGRGRRITERAARRASEPPDVLELDVNPPEDLEACPAR